MFVSMGAIDFYLSAYMTIQFVLENDMFELRRERLLGAPDLIRVKYSEIKSVVQNVLWFNLTVHLVNRRKIHIHREIDRVEGTVPEEWPEAPNVGPIHGPSKEIFLLDYPF